MSRDKEKLKTYNKAYYKANRQKILAQKKVHHKVYYQANKKRINARNKAYRKANLEKAKICGKAWRKANPEYSKAYNKAYYQIHKEKDNNRSKIYRKANLQYFREANRKHHALKRTTEVESISEKEVYLRDGWICQHCKKRVDKRVKFPDLMSLSLDHIVPLSKGGSHTYANVQLVHLSCNKSKKDGVLPQGEQLRIF